MTTTPQLVPAEELRKLWPTLEPMVEAVRARVHGRWIPADVYSFCVSGKAGLYVDYDELGQITGCIVLRRFEDWGHTVLSVWVCYNAHPEQTIVDYFPWLVQTAADMRCNIIEWSGRRGHNRLIDGVRVVDTIMQYEV